MLDLTSKRWGELRDAYGSAETVPSLLTELSAFPAETGSSEPWFSIWSRLCHQGDIYSASFAAVPHILSAAATAPTRTTLSFFLMPASIELARHKHATEIPSDLQRDYFQALDDIPKLAAQAAAKSWDFDFCQAVLAAVAVSKAQHKLAMLLIEVDASEISKMLEWHWSR